MPCAAGWGFKELPVYSGGHGTTSRERDVPSSGGSQALAMAQPCKARLKLRCLPLGPQSRGPLWVLGMRMILAVDNWTFLKLGGWARWMLVGGSGRGEGTGPRCELELGCVEEDLLVSVGECHPRVSRVFSLGLGLPTLVGLLCSHL